MVGSQIAVGVVVAVGFASEPPMQDRFGDRVAGECCEPQWVSTFGTVEPANMGINGHIDAMTVFDDGSGPGLFVAGSFTMAGGSPAGKIARWDGAQWSSLGDGIVGSGTVFSLAVYDDGSGPALYVGGAFTQIGGIEAHNIARWDGVQWTPLAGGIEGGNSPAVFAMAVFDGALHVGGRFSQAGGVTVGNMARWDGNQWLGLGAGVSGGSMPVTALAVADAGLLGESSLFVGGHFTNAGATEAQKVARWNGSEWFSLGSSGVQAVNDLLVHDNGSDVMLYVEHDWPAIKAWDGNDWTELPDLPGQSKAMTVFDDGDGPALYVGGRIGNDAGYVVKRAGSSWVDIGADLDGWATTFTTFDDGVGARPSLYIGGGFATAGSLEVSRLAGWDGELWNAPPTHNLEHAVDGWVLSSAVHDDGTGAALYVGGEFTSVGRQPVEQLAKWDGTAWSSIANEITGGVYAMLSYDDGSGPALYIGGTFNRVESVPETSHIARWKDGSWEGMNGGFNSTVTSLAVYDDGTGAALYAGGYFTMSGDTQLNGIAKWNGDDWEPLNNGISESPFVGFAPHVEAMHVFDDGTGEALYVGGLFVLADDITVNHIAKWNGQTWAPLGDGVSSVVAALDVYDDGQAPALFVGGRFLNAGGQQVNQIAKWDGDAWSSLNEGANWGSDLTFIYALTVFDDGAGGGPELHAAGFFGVETDSGTITTIAKWNGNRWGSLGQSFVGPATIRTLEHFIDTGDNPTLIAGGTSDNSPAGDSYLARFVGCTIAPSLPGDVNEDGIVGIADLLAVLSNWGCTGVCDADVNCDGTVGLADLLAVLTHWGQTA